MKSIATINTAFPTVDDCLKYHSGASLLDFDIAVIDPRFPYFGTESFTNGGYCVSIDSAKAVLSSMQHWRSEILAAIKRGSSVFVILNESETENFAISTTSTRRHQVTYNTSSANNYSTIPGSLSLRNAKGRKIVVKDDLFKSLFDIIRDIVEYRVIVENNNVMKTGFSASDGSLLGGIATFKDMPGHLVFLPYFNLEDMTEITNGETVSRSK